jgi:hypothetical protein
MVRDPRMPSQSQIRSQVRSAQRKAERDLNSIVTRETRKFEATARSEIQRAERRSRSQVRSAANSQPRQTLTYSVSEATALDSWTEAAEEALPNDIFLSHAWPDRAKAASDLYNELRDFGLAVWFSEVELQLGVSLARQLDRALANCKAGLVLVTPAFLTAVQTGSWAERELGVLLGSERVIPVLHDVDFDDVRRVSPFLADRNGLTTAESSFREVAEKIAANLSV